ncbi:hypothetical protein WDV93_10495 [Pantoea ananatis]
MEAVISLLANLISNHGYQVEDHIGAGKADTNADCAYFLWEKVISYKSQHGPCKKKSTDREIPPSLY